VQTKDARPWRLVVFIGVSLLHLGWVGLLLRVEQLTLPHRKIVAEPFAYIYLPRAAPPPGDTVPSPILRNKSDSSAIRNKPAPRLPISSPSDLFPPRSPPPPAPPPEIDWEHEAALAVQNGIANAEKEQKYRDLSASLSPSQLNWIKQNHMQPAAPGMTWRHPRVEITRDGMPIVHINDHCVLVPLFLIPMVFCSIGHITPNGQLLQSMRDPPQQ